MAKTATKALGDDPRVIPNHNQIYAVVNDIAQQSMGGSAIKAVDTATFVSLGDQILSSQTNTTAFMQTLVQRIGRTVISYRPYTNKLRSLAYEQFEWGAILQKIKVEMPVAVEDQTLNLTDGYSIDPYIVKKPVAHQKLFVRTGSETFFITTQTRWLREAFLSETAMGSFLAAVTGEVRNALELKDENLGRMAIATYIANMASGQKVHLLTEYNTLSGETVTASNALINKGFLAWAFTRMKTVGEKMEYMSVAKNADGYERHTPAEEQRFITSIDFVNAMETVVKADAFHEGYFEKVPFIKMPYWQAELSPNTIKITAEDESTVTVSNIFGLISDRWAFGTYRELEEVLTTPVNARGSYYNTFWHGLTSVAVDTSEQGILFLLD